MHLRFIWVNNRIMTTYRIKVENKYKQEIEFIIIHEQRDLIISSRNA